MKNKNYLVLFVFMFVFPALAKEGATNQRLRIIKSLGSSQYWVKKDAKWHSLKQKTALKPGHTIKTLDDATLQLSFEPAITAVMSKNSLLNLNKLLINHAQKAIRMRHNFQKGQISFNMPTDLGYTLLFTIITPSAHIYIHNADFKVSVNQYHVTTVEVLRGSLKILNVESGVKEVVNMDRRAIITLGKPDISLSSLTETPGKLPPVKEAPMSVAILSIYSNVVPKDNLEPLSDQIAQAIERKSKTEVLFLEDVRKMMKAEGIEDLLNCHTDSCITKIGNFLGVDLVVIGKLGQIGNRYLFNLKMIDALRDRTKSRISAVVDNDIGVIFNEVPSLIDTLIKGKIIPEPKIQRQQMADTKTGKQINKGMVWIFPGTYQMGAKAKTGEIDELPLHKVSLNGFYIDKYEVTREDFERVMGYNPSKFKGCRTCPVENVSWFEAEEYCSKIGKRLPTEAEWEYACRGGTTSSFHYGEILSSDQANFNGLKPHGNARRGPYKQKPLPVGSFKPNASNVYDMHGNVWEWCSDWYDVAYYGNSETKSPKGPKNGQYKVVRGGSWSSDGAALRSANRISYSPAVRLNTIGFRCVKDSY